MKHIDKKRISRIHSAALIMLSVFFLGSSSLSAKTLHVNLSASKQAIPDYETSTTFLKVDLEGIRPKGISRAPLNLALVIDRSGSMSGEKIADAKNAAIHVIQQLQRNDIVSVITYSDSVEVLIPATKVADKKNLIQRIRRIGSNGNTALFAGVSKGAAEIRKFTDKERINRVILLSDGLANVGPSSPRELAQLGRSLARERISVTTLGLGNGYNEDLMTKLAYNSDGNHVFVEHSAELADIFSQEMGELFSVTAKEVCVTIEVSDDLEILRFLGREGNIRGNIAEITLNQVADQQEKYVMIEVQHNPTISRNASLYADVDINYLNAFDASRHQSQQRFEFQRVENKKLVDASVDKNVVEDATLQIATLNTERAVELRDEGKLEEAKDVFRYNAEFLEEVQKEYDLPALAPSALGNFADAKSVDDDEAWESKRKQLREEQNTVRTGQSVGWALNRYLPSKSSSNVDKDKDSSKEKDSTSSSKNEN